MLLWKFAQQSTNAMPTLLGPSCRHLSSNWDLLPFTNFLAFRLNNVKRRTLPACRNSDLLCVFSLNCIWCSSLSTRKRRTASSFPWSETWCVVLRHLEHNEKMLTRENFQFGNDKTQHINLSLATSFCKFYGSEFFPGSDPPPDAVVGPEQRVAFKALFTDYWNSVIRRLKSDHNVSPTGIGFRVSSFVY